MRKITFSKLYFFLYMSHAISWHDGIEIFSKWIHQNWEKDKRLRRKKREKKNVQSYCTLFDTIVLKKNATKTEKTFFKNFSRKTHTHTRPKIYTFFVLYLIVLFFLLCWRPYLLNARRKKNVTSERQQHNRRTHLKPHIDDTRQKTFSSGEKKYVQKRRKIT